MGGEASIPSESTATEECTEASIGQKYINATTACSARASTCGLIPDILPCSTAEEVLAIEVCNSGIEVGSDEGGNSPGRFSFEDTSSHKARGGMPSPWGATVVAIH